MKHTASHTTRYADSDDNYRWIAILDQVLQSKPDSRQYRMMPRCKDARRYRSPPPPQPNHELSSRTVHMPSKPCGTCLCPGTVSGPAARPCRFEILGITREGVSSSVTEIRRHNPILKATLVAWRSSAIEGSVVNVCFAVHH